MLIWKRTNDETLNALSLWNALQDQNPLVDRINLDFRKFNSVKEYLDKAKGFQDWCYINQDNITTLVFKGGMALIPKEIWGMKNLETLDLSYNQLASMPAEIGLLTNLKTLNLTGNQLDSVPAEIRLLTHLTDLILCQNKLTSVSLKIAKLPNINSIDLRGNPLIYLPEFLNSHQVLVDKNHEHLLYHCCIQ